MIPRPKRLPLMAVGLAAGLAIAMLVATSGERGTSAALAAEPPNTKAASTVTPAPSPGATPAAGAEPAASAPGKQTATAPQRAVAIFAAGCFWCVERDFDQIAGVLETTSGYIGGDVANPTYEEVATEQTGHVEAVRVTYDATRVSYRELLDYYWHHVDPTDGLGQFCDRGLPYRPAIFTVDAKQKALAEKSKKDLEESGRFARVAVAIEPAFRFWPAEAEHQDFYKKNPYRYRFYRLGCGRDARLAQVWGNDYTH